MTKVKLRKGKALAQGRLKWQDQNLKLTVAYSMTKRR